MKIDAALRRSLSAMLRVHIRAKYGTQASAAKAWNCTPTFVSRVLTGDRPPTDAMMDDAGIVLVPIWGRFVPGESPSTTREGGAA